MSERATEPSRVPDEERTPRRRILAAIGLLLVLSAATLGLLRSPLFGADRLVVEGTRRLSPERVLEIAGISRGQNVVWFDADGARRRLESDPWIAEAAIRPDLPDTISVRISERVAVGAVQTHEGWQVLAADGVVLASRGGAPNLPTITVAVPGEDVDTTGAGLLGAMDPDLRSRVRSLTIGADGLVRLALHGGVAVVFGEPRDAEAKSRALAAVLGWAADEGARLQSIDISLPAAPTALLAGGALARP